MDVGVRVAFIMHQGVSQNKQLKCVNLFNMKKNYRKYRGLKCKKKK